MGRSPCCQNMRLKKGPWTPEEDEKLTAYVQEHGHGNWRWLPAKAGLQRCGKSCRLRWINYLKPDIKRGKFSMEEDRTIVQLHAFLGNRWSIIAAHLPKRTDNEIKNYWNTHLKKRLIKMGIDPITHKPKTEALGKSRDAAYLRHMAQWESARLEAEARLGSSSSSCRLPDRLMVSKVPPQPSLPPCLDILKAWQSLWGLPSEDDNNRSLYYMYAIMLANDDGLLESPASVSNAKLPTNTIETSSSGGPKQNPNVELREKRVEEDRYDDIMVAVEAFRAARHQNIMEGPNDDMSAFDSYEKLAEEIEDENDMKYYWNSLVNWDI